MSVFYQHLIWRVVCLAALTVLASCMSGRQQEQAVLPGVWQVEDIGGQGVVDYSPATIVLQADGRIGGNASCNTYGGTYIGAASTGSQQSFSTSELISTRRACAEALMRQEQRFFDALGKVRSWEVSQSRGQLSLMDAAGTVQIQATRQAAQAEQEEVVQPRMFTFQCAAGESFTVYYELYEAEGQRIALSEDELMLHDEQTQLTTRMTRLISASGARYGSGDLEFWEHAGEATVLQSEETLYHNCQVH